MKTVLITGSSRGIGRAIAKKLGELNYRIIINYNNSESSAIELQNEIRSLNVDALAIKADISQLSEVESLFNTIEEKFGGVDILINNAGISKTSLFQDLSPLEFQEIFNINVFGMYNTIHCALPYMLKKHDGVILNISSIWGSNGASCEVAYSATKGAVESLTKSLAVELAPSNIRVNAIAPGVVNTDMMKCYSNEDLQLICNDIPMLRLADPREIAELAAYIVSEKNSYMTGQIIGINGGMCV
ncbi:3-oxoacyl-[acyl-carrier protein] reductase [Anaerosphaera aminiphila DSM 21120]|uniref:3-oxoacyl-[acyl-carrier protein] reductase n=1 Tax=Anaerosphaera aminiphila DSM 21120 TaxID=1120995 RepID=A0A1M5T7N5_9FIRM|nr:SDR family oxidoreductase [Anaerosphaera aminiphila]SHH46749.1 3-oxoacyl-[acyl-carrier protein] reductase [Anaerosphaera aminiphila DSM 21120]